MNHTADVRNTPASGSCGNVENLRTALHAGLRAGRFAGRSLAAVAEATREAADANGSPDGAVLSAVARYITQGPQASTATLRDAVAEVLRSGWPAGTAADAMTLTGHAAGLLWDIEALEQYSTLLLDSARSAPAPSPTIRTGLNERTITALMTGDMSVASALCEEESMLVQDTVTHTHGQTMRVFPGLLGLAVHTGRETQARYLILAGSQDAHHRGDGAELCFINWSAALLYNGIGRYDDALRAARAAAAEIPAQRYRNLALSELVEAGVRTGHDPDARDATEELHDMATSSGSDWARGLYCRARAQICAGDGAEAHFLEAIRSLEATPLRPEVARTHLLYGDWLRRHRRAVQARDHLRRALGAFEDMGMLEFARRAREELAAAGDSGIHAVSACAGLTAREYQISCLAAEGASNAQIAKSLFITNRTVEYHLHKVFRKLNVGSRTQLARRMLALSVTGDFTDADRRGGAA